MFNLTSLINTSNLKENAIPISQIIKISFKMSSIKWEYSQWDYKLVQVLGNKIQEPLKIFFPL